jgi:hypothetical protein
MYLMKDIPERTWWRISQNVPDEGYSRTFLTANSAMIYSSTLLPTATTNL